MCTAVGALDLRADSVWIGQAFHRARNLVVETWPAAVSFELALGTVERFAATFADIGSALPEGVVFAGEGRLCAFVDYYLFFFFAEFM